MVAGTASHATGGGGAGVFPSREWEGTPPAYRWGCAFVAVVSEAMANRTLRVGIEPKPLFSSVGGRKSSYTFAE